MSISRGRRLYPPFPDHKTPTFRQLSPPSEMPVLVSSLLSLTTGLTVVALTSPTIAHLFHDGSYTFLNVCGGFVDLIFAVLVALTILCRIEPTWIACNHSFPYTSQPEWNFGQSAFNFQLLVFEIFHQQWSSRFVHTVNITAEGFLWLLVLKITFGMPGLLLIVGTLIIQAISYRDMILSACVSLITISHAAATWAILSWSPYDAIDVLNAAKIALICCSAARTVNHAFEPLPPKYHPSVTAFDEGFGETAFTLCSRNFLQSLWLMALGLVSELAAGSPGRFFNPIVYKMLWRAGYRSQVLLSVSEAKQEAVAVIEGGWHANPTTASLYSWATRNSEKLVPQLPLQDGAAFA
ncbi:hypothetical protein LTR92_006642 [Exophiala xenobiotica]|nr:hypothetical protein LTR92_006642 [Exophiala xenobiotica]KAK5287082.1 hypothetical protein LTR14_009499 [Exophiala xenobiotica]